MYELAKKWNKSLFDLIKKVGQDYVDRHGDLFSETVDPLLEQELIPYLANKNENEIIEFLLYFGGLSRKNNFHLVSRIMLFIDNREDIDNLYTHPILKNYY